MTSVLIVWLLGTVVVTLWVLRVRKERRYAAILSDYVDLLMEKGIGSEEQAFLTRYAGDHELWQHLLTARRLYRALGAEEE